MLFEEVLVPYFFEVFCNYLVGLSFLDVLINVVSEGFLLKN